MEKGEGGRPMHTLGQQKQMQSGVSIARAEREEHR